MNNVLNELSLPFHPSLIEWKPQSVTKDGAKGMAIAYADVRAYMKRLDEVCGLNWSVTFTPWGDRIVCHLTINGVTRSSTGEGDSQSERSEIAGTAAEAQAFKRAATMFGLGRYLYDLPSVWVEMDGKQFSAAGKAKLTKLITDHYQRNNRVVNKATGEIAESRGPSNSQQADPSVASLPPWEGGTDGAESDVAVLQATAAMAGTGMDDGALLIRRKTFNLAGREVYGEAWSDKCGPIIQWYTDNQIDNVDRLTVGQLDGLIIKLRSKKAKK